MNENNQDLKKEMEEIDKLQTTENECGKRFIISWFGMYECYIRGQRNSEIVDESVITEDRGFFPENIESIKKMEVGTVLNLSGPYPDELFISRIY